MISRRPTAVAFIKRPLFSIAVACMIALALWLTICDLFIENDDPYTAAPANTEWVELGSNRIAYQYTPADTDRSVVLVGGTTAWSGVWRYTVDDLKGAYNVYAIDLPPFGYSVVDDAYDYNLSNQADLLNEFVEAHNLNGVILVAHSYGAGPAMEAVLRKPDLYSKFILIDGAIHVDRDRSGGAAFISGIFNIPTFRYLLTSTAVHFPGFIEASLKYLVYDNSSVDEFWVEIYKRPLSVENKSQTLAKWFYDFVFKNGTGLSSESGNYAHLPTPVTIVWGREDNLTPLEQGKYLHAIIPNNEFIVLDNVGHIPMIDDHDRYIEILKKQLAK
jgi:pimeloyl-ACP methyl ester carboxylesterase